MIELFLALMIVTLACVLPLIICEWNDTILPFFKKFSKKRKVKGLENEISRLERALDSEKLRSRTKDNELELKKIEYDKLLEGAPRFTVNDKVVFKSRELALRDYGLKTYEGQYFTMMNIMSGEGRYIVCENRNVYVVLESDLEWFTPSIIKEESVLW